jgi:hypothetical protein
VEDVQTGAAHDPNDLVVRVADALRARGADAILAALERL